MKWNLGFVTDTGFVKWDDCIIQIEFYKEKEIINETKHGKKQMKRTTKIVQKENIHMRKKVKAV